MSGFLDQYGVADARKSKLVKRAILGGLLAIVLGGTGYLYFRTWGEERTLKEFFATLDKQDFQGAYRMWGCSQDKPCTGYDPKRFNEDWGPDTPYAKGSAAQVANIDFCDEGVVFQVTYPKAEPLSLYVERSTKVISFAPWPRCPGRHIQFRGFLDRIFGKS